MKEALLKIENLQVTFPLRRGKLQALRGLSYTLNEGEILGIVGESGSGKSVSTQAILRLLPPIAQVEGTILYKGQDVSLLEKKELSNFRGQEVAMIFQEPGRSFDPLYTMEKTFLETLRLRNPDKEDEDLRKIVIELLEEVQIPQPEERLKSYPHQFSGGQLQRVMIALSLASNPSLLIADEPTTALDVTIQAQIINLLLRLRKKRNMAIIFISHDLELVAHIADKIMVLYAGLEMEEGLSQEIYKQPYHPYSKGLLHALPRFGTHYSVDKLITIPGRVPDPVNPPMGCPFAPRCDRKRDDCELMIPDLVKKGGRSFRCVHPLYESAPLSEHNDEGELS